MVGPPEGVTGRSVAVPGIPRIPTYVIVDVSVGMTDMALRRPVGVAVGVGGRRSRTVGGAQGNVGEDPGSGRSVGQTHGNPVEDVSGARLTPGGDGGRRLRRSR